MELAVPNKICYIVVHQYQEDVDNDHVTIFRTNHTKNFWCNHVSLILPKNKGTNMAWPLIHEQKHPLKAMGKKPIKRT